MGEELDEMMMSGSEEPEEEVTLHFPEGAAGLVKRIACHRPLLKECFSYFVYCLFLGLTASFGERQLTFNHL